MMNEVQRNLRCCNILIIILHIVLDTLVCSDW